MEIYRIKLSSFKIDFAPIRASKHQPCEFTLWTLLSKCPFGSSYIPATYISLVTIDMPLVYQGKFTADQCLAFGKPSHVKIVEGAITRIVIKANNAYGGWYDEKKAY
jgi:hypothetical protein